MTASYPAYYSERIETMPRADLAALQEARLMNMLAFAYDRAPLIRETWDRAGVTAKDIRSIEDYRNLAPFIDKNAIRRFRDTHNDPSGGLKAVSHEEIRGVASTSGTTGDPTPVLRGWRILQEQSLLREYWQIGARPGDIIASLGFTFRVGHQGRTNGEAGFTSLLFNHEAAELPRFFEASKRFRPSIVFVLSHPLIGAIEQLLEKTGEDPKEIFSSYKGACFGGEPLGQHQAALLKSWGLEIFEYGPMGDITGVMECKAHNGFHAWEDFAFLECLDPDGDTPVPEGGIGELVVTSIYDKYQPLIRFRTDDLVKMTSERCSCGRTHLRYWIIGRKGDQLTIAGRRILPKELQNIVESTRETRAGLFQIVKPADKVDVLRVRVGYDPSVLTRDLSALKSELVDKIAAAFALDVSVELVLEQELLKLGPPHKIPRVTSK